MKKVKTSDIIGAAANMPIKAGTLEHLQYADQEGIQRLIKAIYGIIETDTNIWVMEGCELTGSTTPGNPCDITAGIVYYNGELFSVAAFTTANVVIGVVGNIATAFYTAVDSGGFQKADTVRFTDGIDYNVHEIRTILITDAAPASGLADFDDWQFTIYKKDLVDANFSGGTIAVGAPPGNLTAYLSKGKFEINVDLVLSGGYASPIINIDNIIPPYLLGTKTKKSFVAAYQNGVAAYIPVYAVLQYTGGPIGTIGLHKQDETNWADDNYSFQFSGEI